MDGIWQPPAYDGYLEDLSDPWSLLDKYSSTSQDSPVEAIASRFLLSPVSIAPYSSSNVLLLPLDLLTDSQSRISPGFEYECMPPIELSDSNVELVLQPVVGVSPLSRVQSAGARVLGEVIISPIQAHHAPASTKPVAILAVLHSGRDTFRVVDVYTQDVYGKFPPAIGSRKGDKVNLYSNTLSDEFLENFEEGKSIKERIIACAHLLVVDRALITATRALSSKRSMGGRRFAKLKFSSVYNVAKATDIQHFHCKGLLVSRGREGRFGMVHILDVSESATGFTVQDLKRVASQQSYVGELFLPKSYEPIDVTVRKDQCSDKTLIEKRDVMVQFGHSKDTVDGFYSATLVDGRHYREECFQVVGKFTPSKSDKLKGKMQVEWVKGKDFDLKRVSFIARNRGQVAVDVPQRYLADYVGEYKHFANKEEALEALLRSRGELEVEIDDHCLLTNQGFTIASINSDRLYPSTFFGNDVNRFAALTIGDSD